MVGQGCCRRCYQQAWQVTHRDQSRQYTKKFQRTTAGHATRLAYLRRPEVKAKSQASVRAWLQKNPGWAVEKERRRRALKLNTPLIERITVAQWEQLKRWFGYRCAWCEVEFPPKDLTMDHVQPLSAGGVHALRNIVPACKSCNSFKRAVSIPNLPWND